VAGLLFLDLGAVGILIRFHNKIKICVTLLFTQRISGWPRSPSRQDCRRRHVVHLSQLLQAQRDGARPPRGRQVPAQGQQGPLEEHEQLSLSRGNRERRAAREIHSGMGFTKLFAGLVRISLPVSSDKLVSSRMISLIASIIW
jgi:hypothetical protein